MHSNTVPRVAMALLDQSSEELLQGSFNQCRIHAISLKNKEPERLISEKFEGCVLPLNDRGESLLELVRTSPMNRRIVVYGVSQDERLSARSLKLGVNTVFRAPLERADTVNRVRSTMGLLIHEFRRYVRIPLVMPVSVHVGSRSFGVLSREISGGGMSVELCESEMPSGTFRVVFALPEAPSISIRVTTCWQNGGLTGFQFDVSDAGRLIVRDWIDKWLGIDSDRPAK